MKIGIIGFGYVGNAIGWSHRHDLLVIRDPKIKNSADFDQFVGCNAIYVCAPTPSLSNGECDTTVLEEILKELSLVLLDTPTLIICKSTAPPGTYERLHKQYPTIVHCPEFLTAADSVADYNNASYFVLGGDQKWCTLARDVIMHAVPRTQDRFMITDIKSAALYKYMMNSYLATKVTFMNEFAELAQALDITWDDFKNLAVHDERIGDSHMSVPGPDGQLGWGGACFPKDIAAIIHEANHNNVNFDLMSNVVDINNQHRSTSPKN
jgi:UDPglucose 6-dehydrogenase